MPLLLALPTRWEGTKRDGDLPEKQLPSLKQYRNMQAQNDPGLLQAPTEMAHFDFWSYVKGSFVLALRSSSHHRKYFMSTYKVLDVL